MPAVGLSQTNESNPKSSGSASIPVVDPSQTREAEQPSSGSASTPAGDSSQTRVHPAGFALTLSKEKVHASASEVLGEGGAAPRGSIRPPPGLKQ
eukprot:11160513-Lingulodinium_polyedra.AAC.1